MAKVIKRVTVDIEIPDEIFEKIIDNVTEFMYCNFPFYAYYKCKI